MPDNPGLVSPQQIHKIRCKEIFDSIKSCVVVYSPTDGGDDFIIEDFNRAAEVTEKTQRENVVGKKVTEAFPGVAEFGLLEVFRSVYKTGTPVHHPTSLYKDDHITGWRENYVFKSELGEIIAVYEDLTQQKVIEEATKNSEAKYRNLFERAVDPMLIINPSGVVLETNHVFEEKTGYSKDETVGKRFSQAGFLTPDSLQITLHNFTNRIQGVESSPYEVNLILKDGSVMPVEINASAIRENQNIIGVLAILRDISARKTAEKAIKESQVQLQNALEVAGLATWEYDVQKDTFTFNDPFYALFKTTAGEVGGYTMLSADYAKRFVHPDDAVLVGIETKKAIESTDPNYIRRLEHRMTYADGKPGFIAVCFSVVRNNEGRVIKTYGVNQDITKTKLSEIALQESETKFRSIFENSAVGIALVDLGGHYLTVNPAFCHIYGYTENELLQMDFFQVTHPDDLSKSRDLLNDTLNGGGQVVHFTKRYLHADGHTIWADVNSVLIHNPEGKPDHFITQVVDITKSKAAEEEILNRNSELERFNKLTIDRELKMVELKKEIDVLKLKLSQTN